MAQFEWLKEHLKAIPILLLDDIFDKLDDKRVERLLQLVSDHSFGQVLVTDTNRDRLENIFGQSEIPIQYFSVSKGVVTPEQTLKIVSL